jgi:hypothetical protein
VVVVVFFFAEICAGGASYTDDRAGADNKGTHWKSGLYWRFL